jgi:hypothetical protein
MLFDARNKNIYGLGVGISIVFEIFSNFLCLGGGVDPRGHILNAMHTLSVTLGGICF